MAVMRILSLNCMIFLLLTFIFPAARIVLSAEEASEEPSVEAPSVHQCRSHIEAALRAFISKKHEETPSLPQENLHKEQATSKRNQSTSFLTFIKNSAFKLRRFLPDALIRMFATTEKPHQENKILDTFPTSSDEKKEKKSFSQANVVTGTGSEEIGTEEKPIQNTKFLEKEVEDEEETVEKDTNEIPSESQSHKQDSVNKQKQEGITEEQETEDEKTTQEEIEEEENLEETEETTETDIQQDLEDETTKSAEEIMDTESKQVKEGSRTEEIQSKADEKETVEDEEDSLHVEGSLADEEDSLHVEGSLADEEKSEKGVTSAEQDEETATEEEETEAEEETVREEEKKAESEASVTEKESKVEDEESKEETEEAKDEETKTEDEETKTEDEETKTEDEETKTEDEETKAEDEETKAEDEETKAEDEETKAEDGETKAEDEETKAEDEETKAEDEDTKGYEEKTKVDSDEMKTDDEETKTEHEKTIAEDEETEAEDEETKAEDEETKAEDEETKAEDEETKAEDEETKAEDEESKEDLEKETQTEGTTEHEEGEAAGTDEHVEEENGKTETDAKEPETEAADNDADSQDKIDSPETDQEFTEGDSQADKSKGDDEETQEEDDETEEIVESRPHDHIIRILGLDGESMAHIIATEKVIQNTLKDLKKMHENAVKPMEGLYKFKDISNRFVGDAELFSKPMILFIGPWSSGKSAMINYLLDIEDTKMALKTGAEPQSNGFTVLMYGEMEQMMDGIEVAADWTFSSLQKFGQTFQSRLQGVKLPNNLLRKVTIIDTPGILENRKQQERTYPFNDACQWFIDRADIIYVVFDPAKLDMGLEIEALFDQLKGREAQVRIVLNKADSIKPQELMRVQSTLLWNLSPLVGSTEPPIIFVGTFWSKPYLPESPKTLFNAQEDALLQDLRQTIDGRVENKISFTRRHAVRVRNHAKMVDCYLRTYYDHKTFFSNKKKVADEITENPQNYHIYEGLSTLTNVSRYDLPDPDIYRDFFRVNPLYEFKLLASTCSYFKGCPLDRLDIAIAYDLPELMGKYRRQIGASTFHERR